MIVVMVYIVPHGDITQSRRLLAANIVNDGTGTLTSGNYKARFSTSGVKPRGCSNVTVKKFSRKKSGVWKLLYLALKDVFEKGK